MYYNTILAKLTLAEVKKHDYFDSVSATNYSSYSFLDKQFEVFPDRVLYQWTVDVPLTGPEITALHSLAASKYTAQKLIEDQSILDQLL